ncbi:MAG: STAS domain-containing protein [Nocardioidaceae bacterium]|nr:STAS domain-containing protein [Nocardioidaceae bacterium]
MTVRLERLDGVSVAHARRVLFEAIDRAEGDVVLDLADVEWVDRLGLALLAAAHERSHRLGHHLVVHRTHPRLRRTLAVTRLTRVLHLEPA